MKKVQNSTYFFALFPIIFYILTEITRHNAPYWYENMRDEDNFFEYLTVFFYLTASFYAYKIIKNPIPTALKFFFCLICLGCFFIAGEELSWGQRLLSYDSPQFFTQYNDQNEVDLHNLHLPLVSLSGAFDLIFCLICIWGMFGFWLGTRIFARLNIKHPSLYFPPSYLFGYFLLGFLGVFWQFPGLQEPIDNWLLSFKDPIWYEIGTYFFYDPEMAEFLLSCAFLLYIRECYKTLITYTTKN